MVNIITVTDRGQFDEQLDLMFEDRKRVFVDLLKWDLAVTAGRFEIDQFDSDDAVYFIESDAAGRHKGSLRLLRTERPHILSELFPHLCEHGVPADSHTMEITRLCLCPDLPALERLRTRNHLISAIVDYALAHGIEKFTGVVTRRFLSQIMVMGWRCEPLGPAGITGGSGLGAFRIRVDTATPKLLQATGIYSTRTFEEFTEAELSGGELI